MTLPNPVENPESEPPPLAPPPERRARMPQGTQPMLELSPPHWVCIDCGARQAAKGPCLACSKDDTSDLRDYKIRELMRDVDGRLTRQREGRLRFVGVLCGMAAVFGLWMIPGYWGYRASFLALPALFDQWLLMALIGMGVAVLLGRIFDRKRFPYLADDLTIR